MEWSLQRGQSGGSSWTRWVLCVLLAWPALQAYATPSETVGISGPSLAVGYGQNCAIDTAGQLKCWGDNSYGLDRPPAGYYVSVASGARVSCALRSDGEAVCWGDPAGGATTPPPGPWRSLAVGSEQACGLRPDGSLQCWGIGQNGVGALAPTGERFIAVSIAFMDGCAIRTDATLQCWGDAGPDGIALSDVPPGHFTSVSVKNEHACALRSDGRIACWGNNYYGQNDAPTDAGFIAVSAGSHFGCALREDGSAVCWGYLYDGALNAPPGRFTQISSGGAHACATRLDGTAQCWGWDYDYWDGWLHERGSALTGLTVGGGEACALDTDGEAHCAERVPSMQPPTGRYSQLALGAASGCGILSGGAATCWGASLGPTPTAAMSTVSVGQAHACGVLIDGAVACWGDNTYGQTEAPPGRYASIVAGDRYSCGITIAGAVNCWGQDPLVLGIPVGNGFRSLVASDSAICANRDPGLHAVCWGDGGAWLAQAVRYEARVLALGEDMVCWQWYGSTGDIMCFGVEGPYIPNFPYSYLDQVAAAGDLACGIDTSNLLHCSGADPFVYPFNTLRIGTGSVSTGRAHTCSASGSGLVDCWGDNAQRQRAAPLIRASAVGANGDQSCAILGDSSLQCWGDVHRGGGQPLPGTAVRDVDVGQFNGCAVRTDGNAACWGWNVNGQSSPPAETFRRVATGLNHSCGIREDSTLACWGYGADGQTAAPAGEFIALDVGERHSCAIAFHGLLHCWGMDGEGQATPPPGATYRALSAGAFHNCAIRSDGAVVCWGRNDKGQATPPQGRFASVSAGVVHTCAIRDDGARICWGSNGSGQSPGLTIGPDALPRAEVQQAYEVRLVTTGNTGAATFRVASGVLPEWIELDADGLLRAHAYATGGFDFTVEARDASGVVGRRAYRLEVGSSSDTTAPRIASRIIGPMGESGWYIGDIDIRWMYDEPESGIVEMSGCDSYIENRDSGYIPLQCRLKNRGGLVRSESLTLKRDATPPRIVVELRPEAPNAEGWYRTHVDVDYRCSDATSGLVGRCPQPSSLSEEGVHTFQAQSVRDRAGNIATTPSTPIRIDMTHPELTATMPPAQLPVGATHDFQLSARDALSGISSQSCTPVDTATVGTRQAVCQAIDRAGNEAVLSAQYEVIVAKQRGRLRPASPAPRRDVPPKAKVARLR